MISQMTGMFNIAHLKDWYSMSWAPVPSVTTPVVGGLLSMTTPSVAIVVQRSAVLQALRVVKYFSPAPKWMWSILREFTIPKAWVLITLSHPGQFPTLT